MTCLKRKERHSQYHFKQIENHKMNVQLMVKLSYLNPLGAPISALVSLGPFFFPFLSFLPVEIEAGAGVGTGVERYLDATISGFWMSTVGIILGCETGPDQQTVG